MRRPIFIVLEKSLRLAINSEIVELANRLLSLKGIKNGELFLTLPSSVITQKNNLNPFLREWRISIILNSVTNLSFVLH